MSAAAQRDPLDFPSSRLRARVRGFVFLAGDQTGAISIITLVVILLAPLVVMGAVAFVLIVAYANRVSQITAKGESKPKPTVCPACGHELIEIRNFCAECGASIWPPETQSAAETDVSSEESE